MSHWKALARAHDVPSDRVREELVAALETIQIVAAELDCEPQESAILEAIDELQGEVKSAREEIDDADTRTEEAESKLEAKLQEPAEAQLATAIKAREKAEAERDEALARLAQIEPLIEAYSDLLAKARQFVSKADTAGIKTRHVRRARPATVSR